ncbi:MAG TPA: tRNA dihydrouridine(16) synthase DusC [Succinivibrionaceae bacterium]|nr:tRNA-dihydrouridine synthase family protein [Succinivibrio sp.]HAR80653.1 tRNA dihydrouridine(16) synthase DusC [Succinivibrionaceae bacterium]
MNTYKVYLAPMDGVTDPPFRKILCRHGGYDISFTEFLRVTDVPILEKAILRDVPELRFGGKTEDGTPIRVQLLGDHPGAMAATAVAAVKLGAQSIDINFGCPSRFVHHSGSMLLAEPELLHTIVSTVRDHLPAEIPLSVKIRSGFADKKEAPDIVKAIAIPGVSEIIMHCRTRKELYKRDCIDWTVLEPFSAEYPDINFVANGEINSLSDAVACEAQSHCTTFMTGRGAIAIANLGYVIKEKGLPYDTVKTLNVLLEIMNEFVEMDAEPRIVLNRAKQFLGYARKANHELAEFFCVFCRSEDLNNSFKLTEKFLTRIGK